MFQNSDIVPRVGVFTAGAANCGIDDPNVYSVHRLGFPCSMEDLIQELGRAGRRREASPITDSFRIFINIHDFAYVMVRSFRNARDLMKETSSITGNTVHAIAKRTAILDRAKRSKNRDRADLFEVVSFLCLNLGCIHSRLEFAQTDPMLRHQYTMSPSCGNACYFCNNQYKQMFRAVSYSGV